MTALHIITLLAALALSLAVSCLGIVALAMLACDVAMTRRRQSLDPSGTTPDGGAWARTRARCKSIGGLLALAVASAMLFWLSYALARWAIAPMR